MLNIINFENIIFENLNDIVQKYNYFVEKTDDTIFFKSLSSIISFYCDKYSYTFDVEIMNPVEIGNSYSIIYLIKIYDINLYKILDKIGTPQDEEGYFKIIKLISNFIKRHCSAILSGDYSIREKYLEVKSQFATAFEYLMLEIDRNDPIYVKYSNGDSTWEDDIQKFIKSHSTNVELNTKSKIV